MFHCTVPTFNIVRLDRDPAKGHPATSFAMPVRQIPKNYRNVTGILASAKSNGQAQFESTLERDFLTLLEFSPDVRSFEVQPVVLRWRDGGCDRRYTPDVLAHYESPDGLETTAVLYEVKYRDDLRRQWSETRPRLKMGMRFARAQGWRFKVVTDTEIRTPLLENARFLLPFVRQGPPPAADMELLDRTLMRLDAAKVGELLVAACRDEWNRARLLPTLWYLVGTRHFGAELNAPLNMGSLLWSRE